MRTNLASGKPVAGRWLMRLLSAFLIALLIALPANVVSGGDVSVRGYFRSNGTYVQPHYRSAPDGNPYNNWSFPGNTNPYTGKTATGDPLKYLERYYSRRGTYGGSSGIIAKPGTTWSAGPLARLPALPDYVAQEDLARSKAYCDWLYTKGNQGNSQCQAEQYSTLAALTAPDYSGLPSAEVSRSSKYCEWLYGNNRAGFYRMERDCRRGSLGMGVCQGLVCQNLRSPRPNA
jgi:hypothetical protein